MFKLKAKQEPEVPAVAPEVLEQIKVMPLVYYKAKKEKVAASKIFVLLAAILAVAGVGAAIFILVNNYLMTPSLPLTNESALGGNEPANVNLPPPPPPSVPTGTPPAALSGTTDEDGDGLTLNEERLYLTNVLNSDTDGDGYADGSEIINGYDPRQAGQILAAANLIEVYSNNFGNYSVNKPINWLVTQLDAEGREVTLDAKVGEFIKIAVKTNPQFLALTDWIAENDLLQSLDQLVPVSGPGLPGLQSSDGLKYYLASPDLATVYVISYEAAGLSSVSFKTTLQMMVKSFKGTNKS